MKVLVVGANGQIGKHLVKQIQDHEDLEARALIRKEEQASYFHDLGAETAIVDLEGEVAAIAKATEGVDAVVFTAGSGPNTGADKTLMIDLDGAVKTMEAAEQAGVKRYVMISSYDTTREAIQSAPESFAPYVVAKHYADEWLRGTNLDHTIIHPGRLTNDEGTGQVAVAPQVDRGDVPREDVARVIVETLANDSTIGKEYQVISGDQSVADAVKAQ
ncbi:sugar epimerase [Pontibacillus halophilus JSM 076056 = DSM 19796]|uniref:Sugar epimerase n=1 Tax=Pontibacillus halophilus JSM 076056 = DSM 19796 TaxID=1385510 RepID=A0A0A5GB86_9BACI|nr:SDR family oxidoreductase [Pontibacillus halophilus]KGX89309.1 sugar epimerase [Pontibacillus halophilus JSM 076056 = DSM 19796]